MEIKPVIHKAKPKYPDKYEIEADKTLLYNYPKRWLKMPLMGLTVAALMASGVTLSGCRWGATGGKPMDLIYHLSDEDALKVIADELTKAGYEYVDGSDNENFAFDAHFIDGENKIDLEYISQNDINSNKYSELKTDASRYYNFEDFAKELKETYPDAAVFQDPYSETQESAESEIRQQVLDFIEWLISVGAEA